MPRLIKGNAVVDDAYFVAGDAKALCDLPRGVPVLVPLAVWRAHRDALRTRGEVGVWLAPADDPLVLVDDVASLGVIAIDFPAFTDGRGYSSARLLRERLGYAGELRAIGDVQRDHLYHLRQVGFDAFSLAEGRDSHAALVALGDFSDGYQVTNVRTPWFRRRNGEGAPA